MYFEVFSCHGNTDYMPNCICPDISPHCSSKLLEDCVKIRFIFQLSGYMINQCSSRSCSVAMSYYASRASERDPWWQLCWINRLWLLAHPALPADDKQHLCGIASTKSDAPHSEEPCSLVWWASFNQTDERDRQIYAGELHYRSAVSKAWRFLGRSHTMI